MSSVIETVPSPGIDVNSESGDAPSYSTDFASRLAEANLAYANAVKHLTEPSKEAIQTETEKDAANILEPDEQTEAYVASDEALEDSFVSAEEALSPCTTRKSVEEHASNSPNSTTKRRTRDLEDIDDSSSDEDISFNPILKPRTAEPQSLEDTISNREDADTPEPQTEVSELDKNVPLEEIDISNLDENIPLEEDNHEESTLVEELTNDENTLVEELTYDENTLVEETNLENALDEETNLDENTLVKETEINHDKDNSVGKVNQLQWSTGDDLNPPDFPQAFSDKDKADIALVLDQEVTEIKPEHDVSSESLLVENHLDQECAYTNTSETAPGASLESDGASSSPSLPEFAPSTISANVASSASTKADSPIGQTKILNVTAPEFSPRNAMTPSSSLDSLSDQLKLNAEAPEFSPRAAARAEQHQVLHPQAREFSPKMNTMQYPMSSCGCNSPLLQDTVIGCRRERETPPDVTERASPIFGAWTPLTWSRSTMGSFAPAPAPPPVTRYANSPMQRRLSDGSRSSRESSPFEYPQAETHKVLNISIKTPPRKPPKFRVQNTQTDNINCCTSSSQTRLRSYRDLNVQTESCDAREVCINTMETMADYEPVVPDSWDASPQRVASPGDGYDAGVNTKKDILCVDVSRLDVAVSGIRV